jgi:hypothetical protein
MLTSRAGLIGAITYLTTNYSTNRLQWTQSLSSY